MEVILASASPRRRDILNKHGVKTIVIPSEADETLPPELEDASPEKVVMYLAMIKAQAICRELDEAEEKGCPLPGVCVSIDSLPKVIIAADTVVYRDDIIGKPVDADDAFRILSSLRGSSHGVYTGVAVIIRGGYKTAMRNIEASLSNPKYRKDKVADFEAGQSFEDVKMAYSEYGGNGVFFDYDLTTVTFKDYPDEEIWRYIKEEPPFDKSGSYAVQSSWSKNIASVDGDVENVMGLPWHLIESVLSALE